MIVLSGNDISKTYIIDTVLEDINFTVNDRERIEVNGVTTGAEIFCVASLGIGIGLGLYEIVLTVVILVEINIVIAMGIKNIINVSKLINLKKVILRRI